MSKTPRGHYICLTKALKRIAQREELSSFDKFLRGPFREQIGLVPPDLLGAVLSAALRTREACTQRTRLPAPPIKRTNQLDWRNNAALRERLAHHYDKFGPTGHKQVAAAMRLSVGQVRLAKRRYLDAAGNHAYERVGASPMVSSSP